MKAAVRVIGRALHALAVVPITQAAILLMYVSGGAASRMWFPWAALGLLASIAYLVALVAWLRRRWLRASLFFALSLIGPWWAWAPSALVPAGASAISLALARSVSLRRGP